MLGTGGFHHDRDYALVIFINKIHFDFGNFAVLQAEGYCTVDKLLQVIDSHVQGSPLHYAGKSCQPYLSVEITVALENLHLVASSFANRLPERFAPTGKVNAC